jgi:hypothetical protein
MHRASVLELGHPHVTASVMLSTAPTAESPDGSGDVLRPPVVNTDIGQGDEPANGMAISGFTEGMKVAGSPYRALQPPYSPLSSRRVIEDH